jgi:hypothetical protein
MNKNQNPQHMGGPSFTPDLTEGQQKNLAEPRGKPGKVDPKSEAIREKHGDSYENYPSVKPAADKAVKENKTGR